MSSFPKGNPTLLSLLKAGATVEIGEVRMKGDTKHGYIEIFHDLGGYQGQWNLDKEGLDCAIKDCNKMLSVGG
jgi:hypothetical protein